MGLRTHFDMEHDMSDSPELKIDIPVKTAVLVTLPTLRATIRAIDKFKTENPVEIAVLSKARECCDYLIKYYEMDKEAERIAMKDILYGS